MVGGVHGLLGHHVLQHVVMVREPDNVPVIILHHQWEEVIALVTTPRERFVTSLNAQVQMCMAIVHNFF